MFLGRLIEVAFNAVSGSLYIAMRLEVGETELLAPHGLPLLRRTRHCQTCNADKALQPLALVAAALNGLGDVNDLNCEDVAGCLQSCSQNQDITKQCAVLLHLMFCSWPQHSASHGQTCSLASASAAPPPQGSAAGAPRASAACLPAAAGCGFGRWPCTALRSAGPDSQRLCQHSAGLVAPVSEPPAGAVSCPGCPAPGPTVSVGRPTPHALAGAWLRSSR